MRSIKVSSRQPLNQFLSIEYFPSFQTLLDKIANFGENSVFRNSENFHIFEKFCLGVNTYKGTSGHPYHTQRLEQDRRNWKKCLFFDTKSALRTFEPPLNAIMISEHFFALERICNYSLSKLANVENQAVALGTEKAKYCQTRIFQWKVIKCYSFTWILL